MLSPLQDSQRTDREFERRSMPFLIVHLLAFIPLLVLASLVYLENNHLPSIAIIITCAAYVTSTFVQYFVMRAAVLKGMRREKLVADGYEPPGF